MARTDLGGITADDIELPSGLSWDIDVGSLNLSKAIRRMYFTDSISQSGEFELDVVFTPQNVSGGDKLTITKEDQDAFYGVLSRPGKSSQGESTLSGGGAAEVLRDKPVNGEFLGYDIVDLVDEVFDQLDVSSIKVGVNEELTDGTGVVDARADDEGALTFLNRIVASHGGEWYTSYDSENDQFEFNVVNKLESSSVQKTFTQNNTKKIEDELVIDEEYDGVIVKGYGDGDDQITGVYPERDNWPSDPKILKFTDKTILSEDEAANTAESVYNKHDEWRSIYVYPSSHEELLNLGDKVDIDEPRTGFSGTYRVVARTLSLDFKEKKQVEYVLSEKPLGIIDEAENVQEQTDSQTDYEQGAKNKYSDKQSDQANNTNPLRLELHVPDDIEDRSGRNRLKSVSLNYTLKDFRQYLDSEAVSVLENKADASQTGSVDNNKSDASQSGSVDSNKSDASQSGEVKNNSAETSQSGSVNLPNTVNAGFTGGTGADERTTYTGTQASDFVELTSFTPGDTSDVYLGYYGFANFTFQFGNDAAEGQIDIRLEMEGQDRDGNFQTYQFQAFQTVDPQGTGGTPDHITMTGFLPIHEDIFDPGTEISLSYGVDGELTESELQRVTCYGNISGQESHDHSDDLQVDEPVNGHPHTDDFQINEPTEGHPHGDDFQVNEPTDGHPHGDNFQIEEPTNGHPHESSGGDLSININDSGKGSEVEVVIDGDTANSFILTGEQQENVDLLSEYEGSVDLIEPGFHEIQIYPDAASYTIGEVEIDYYKNT